MLCIRQGLKFDHNALHSNYSEGLSMSSVGDIKLHHGQGAQVTIESAVPDTPTNMEIVSDQSATLEIRCGVVAGLVAAWLLTACLLRGCCVVAYCVLTAWLLFGWLLRGQLRCGCISQFGLCRSNGTYESLIQMEAPLGVNSRITFTEKVLCNDVVVCCAVT